MLRFFSAGGSTNRSLVKLPRALVLSILFSRFGGCCLDVSFFSFFLYYHSLSFVGLPWEYYVKNNCKLYLPLISYTTTFEIFMYAKLQDAICDE
jgi:hypothetical protein